MNIVPQCIGTVLLLSISLRAESPLSYVEFEKQLSEFQNRDQKLREQIAEEQANILDIKNQIESARNRISDIRKKKLDALDITAEDVTAASSEVSQLHQELTSLQGLTDEQFKQDSSRLNLLKNRIQVLLSNPASRLRKIAIQLGAVVELNESCERRMATLLAPVVDTLKKRIAVENVEPSDTSYTVQRVDGKPESLFRIAAKVYGDPMQWPKIYQANKTTIDRNFHRRYKNSKPSIYTDPSDLIFPGQVLAIPR